jgi:hypothetical protein
MAASLGWVPSTLAAQQSSNADDQCPRSATGRAPALYPGGSGSSPDVGSHQPDFARTHPTRGGPGGQLCRPSEARPVFIARPKRPYTHLMLVRLQPGTPNGTQIFARRSRARFPSAKVRTHGARSLMDKALVYETRTHSTVSSLGRCPFPVVSRARPVLHAQQHDLARSRAKTSSDRKGPTRTRDRGFESHRDRRSLAYGPVA